MSFPHMLLALLVVVIWGLNFIFVKFALEEAMPLFLCAARFILASVPAVFFIKPPAAPFRIVVSYGLIMFALQFSLVFMGMKVGMTPGMASLLMQTQVFFSIFFAVFLLGEKINFWQIIGALIAFVGMGLVAMHFDIDISLIGFFCILGGAAAWGVGTLIAKKTNKISMLSLVVWGSFASCFPLIFLSLCLEGWQTISYSLHHMSGLGLASMLYIVYLSTWVGYGVWNFLLSRYPVGTVVPFTLLIPVVGILSSVLILGEPFQLWKLATCLLVITGLFLNLFGARRIAVPKLVQEV